MTNRSGRRVALASMAGLCLLLSVAHKHGTAQGGASMVAAPLLALLHPGQQIVASAADAVASVVTPFTARRLDAKEIAALRRRAEVVPSLEARAAELEAENRRLRSLLGMARAQPRSLAARVIADGTDLSRRTIMVNRGARDGVGPRDIVTTDRGLVGQVTQTLGPWSSVVLLLTDPESRVSVLVQRSRAQGVAQGTGGDLLRLVYLPKQASPRVGDVIVTSGRGGVFPPGMLVGKVTRLLRDESGTGVVAEVKTAADLDRLEEVLLVRSPGADLPGVAQLKP